MIRKNYIKAKISHILSKFCFYRVVIGKVTASTHVEAPEYVSYRATTSHQKIVIERMKDLLGYTFGGRHRFFIRQEMLE